MVTTRPPKTIVKPTALGPVANTDTKLLIYGLFQKGRVLAQDAVARWNRDRFRRYWARISRPRYPGRPRIDAEIRRLVRTMAQDCWGAPRIHAELTKLGFVVSEMTVSRYMPHRRAEPDEVKRWIAFLRNHKDDIAAMDLFAVPTASLRLLYGFFVIKHGRRHILHFNATYNPTSAWVIQACRACSTAQG